MNVKKMKKKQNKTKNKTKQTKKNSGFVGERLYEIDPGLLKTGIILIYTSL